jgi:hypothetical protein
MKNCLLLALLVAISVPFTSFAATIHETGSNTAKFNYNSADSYRDTIQWSKRKTAPWFVDRFKISAGLFAATTTTDIKLGGNAGSIGSDIDFEKDLGLTRDVQTFLGNFQWRISRRWRFDFSYYKLNRSSNFTLQDSFIFGDHTYNINVNVNSYFNNAIYRVSCGYAILAKPTAELGLLIGAHTLQTSMGVGISAGGAGVAYSDNFNFTAPLPDLGIWGGWALSKRWALNGEFNYLTVAAGDIKGEIVGYNASLSYKATKHFDLALGYTGFEFTIDAKSNNQSGHIGWGYHGPSISADFRFGHNKWNH